MTQAAHTTSPLTADRHQPVLVIDDLAVTFEPPIGDDRRSPSSACAVDGVNLTLYPRQTLAVVGESGCGKSVTALSVMRLIQPPGRIVRGSIRLNGRDLVRVPPRDMLRVRGREVAMIFQEPMTSLNPVYTIGDQIIEAILLHQDVDRRAAAQHAIDALQQVGISNPKQRLRAYPHEFSGGMRQRVMIAMALACRPGVLLADEPTTALDVTIQAQILDLLRSIQHERDMAIMLITHDLGVVAQNADVVCVMYAGRVVEYAAVFDLFQQPLHPYTRALLRCRPSLRRRVDRLTTVAEIINDPREFNAMPIGGGHLTPWWPDSDSPRSASVMCEIAPQHWVACRPSHVAEQLAIGRPNLSFRRDELPAEGA